MVKSQKGDREKTSTKGGRSARGIMGKKNHYVENLNAQSQDIPAGHVFKGKPLTTVSPWEWGP